MCQPKPDLKSRFLGCLVGCAVGDALGAPFEGYWEHQLPGREALLRDSRRSKDTREDSTPTTRNSRSHRRVHRPPSGSWRPRISPVRSPPCGRITRSSGPAGLCTLPRQTPS